MRRITEKFETKTRDDIIDLCGDFARHVGALFEAEPERTHIIEIAGHYASGKSLIADAIKAVLLEREVEKARWKRIESEDCAIDGKNATISFVNGRYDIGNILCNTAMKRRQFGGPLFVSNRPPIDLGRTFAPLALPPSMMKVSVWFPEGSPRPRQLGPLKFGPSVEIGMRYIDFERYEAAAPA